MPALKAPLVASHPYPGLRAFESSEAMLFFGRDRHTGELLRRLAQNRFLAVVGGSGSGKSSLVRAGLLPALYRGYLVGASSRWRVAVMRPGSAPIVEMAKALSAREALGRAEEPSLRESSYGLVRAVRDAGLDSGESLLLVVDQFEELFRFRRESAGRDGGAEAELFVNQLLRASEEYAVPIYVAITMRSDFLGDCAQFQGLPEALNKGQYLIPRMTREQRREAITDALDFFETSMADRLVQRLLNDAGDDPVRLPVLQHALQQTFAQWEKDGKQGEIDLVHYEKAGTMERALHDHAQQIYESLGNGKWLAERIFRCLTVDENGRAVRRPARFHRILQVTGVAGDPGREQEAAGIVRLFGSPGNSFLLWGHDELQPESVVDISHESLIRTWTTLQGWVRDEARGVDVYCYLRRDAALYPNDAGLWADPDLSRALACKSAMSWNVAWAEQYSQGPGASYEQVEQFLDWSVKDREARRRRERLFIWLKWLASLAGLAILLGVIWANRQMKEKDAIKKELTKAQEAKLAIEQEAGTLKQRADDLLRKIESAPKQADTAGMDRLRQEYEATQRKLSERNALIATTVNQPSSLESADALRRINELQAQLRQAWQERDQAMAKGGKGDVSDDTATVANLRTQLEAARAENTRLQKTHIPEPAPSKPAPRTAAMPPQRVATLHFDDTNRRADLGTRVPDWKEIFLYLHRVPSEDVTVLYIYAVPPAGQSSLRGKEQIEKALQPDKDGILKTGEYHICRLARNDICWLVLATGDRIGLEAKAVASFRDKVTLDVLRAAGE